MGNIYRSGVAFSSEIKFGTTFDIGKSKPLGKTKIKYGVDKEYNSETYNN